MKKCNRCNEMKEDSEFGTRIVASKTYLRSHCRKCESQKRSKNTYNKGVSKKATKRYSDKICKMRAANIDTDRWILSDSQKSDKKKGLQNNLDREFVRTVLAGGCSYCGEMFGRMTLDRIDNNKGHTKDNVVAACIRCNYTRRDMPYRAWMVVSEGMRTARELDLFDGWTGRARKISSF